MNLHFNILFIWVLGLHIALLFLLNFQLPELPKKIPPSLDVILVHSHPTQPPKQADFLAQQNQDGATEKKGLSCPHSKKPSPVQSVQPTKKTPLPQPREQKAALLKEKKILATVQQAEQKVQPGQQKNDKIDIQKLLQTTQAEIQRLSREIEQNSFYASQYPRRKTLTVRTKEYRYAAYLEAWRKKVERIGNLNYPAEAKKRGLHGDLLLKVTLRSDGQVEDIRILRSSGQAILDRAAVNIVRLASPFAPFPDNIKREVELLDIIRTWQFISGQNSVLAK